MVRTMPATFDEFVGAYPSAVQDLARAARAVVGEVLPDADEEVDPAGRVIGYGYGGYKGLVCSIILSKSGVKLGVVGGASLPDPKGLLTGSGKVHKYIALTSTKDAGAPAVRKLLTLAATRCRDRLAGRSTDY